MRPLEVRATDRKFVDSPDAGDPACLCSRCGEPIGEDQVPIRNVVLDGQVFVEYRYHARCVDIEMYEDEGLRDDEGNE